MVNGSSIFLIFLKLNAGVIWTVWGTVPIEIVLSSNPGFHSDKRSGGEHVSNLYHEPGETLAVFWQYNLIQSDLTYCFRRKPNPWVLANSGNSICD